MKKENGKYVNVPCYDCWRCRAGAEMLLSLLKAQLDQQQSDQ